MHLIDSSTNGDQSFFPGITPQNLLKNKKAQQDATQALQSLYKFNVWLEAVVSVSANGHMIITNNNTKLKAYWPAYHKLDQKK